MHWPLTEGCMIYRISDHLSAKTTATIGAGGAGISVMAGMIDPGFLTPWLQLIAVGTGALTGVASFILVALKIARERREGRKPPQDDIWGM